LHEISRRRFRSSLKRFRATKFPPPAFDKALAERKIDKSWSTFEITSSHSVMLDAPEPLTEILGAGCLD
jgi:hypothetical protein